MALAQGAGTHILLDAITITAAGFGQTVRDAPASVSIITAGELAKGRFASLTDALCEVQGVVTTGTANEQDIFIRGLPGQYTLILVDGKRRSTRDARTNGNAGIEQSFIPPIAAIDRIKVVRGPVSSLHGPDAMGGVIQIITRPISDVWAGSVTAETTVQGERGFGNSRQVPFHASGPLVRGTLGLQVWGRKFAQDTSSIAAGPSTSDDYDLGAWVKWAIDDDNRLLLEAGRTRISSMAHGDLSYGDNDRDHWSITHKGRFAGLATEWSFAQEIGERPRSAAAIRPWPEGRAPVRRNAQLGAGCQELADP